MDTKKDFQEKVKQFTVHVNDLNEKLSSETNVQFKIRQTKVLSEIIKLDCLDEINSALHQANKQVPNFGDIMTSETIVTRWMQLTVFKFWKHTSPLMNPRLA
jgi:uncharacterized protein YukE